MHTLPLESNPKISTAPNNNLKQPAIIDNNQEITIIDDTYDDFSTSKQQQRSSSKEMVKNKMNKTSRTEPFKLDCSAVFNNSNDDCEIETVKASTSKQTKNINKKRNISIVPTVNKHQKQDNITDLLRKISESEDEEDDDGNYKYF